MITAVHSDGNEVTRNKSKFKPFPEASSQQLLQEEETEDELPQSVQLPKDKTANKENRTTKQSGESGNNVQRPRRVIKKPNRLIEEV